MGTQVSMNEEVPDILLPEREVDSVISSVKTEVSRYELSTNLAIWDSDSDLDMDEIICDVGNGPQLPYSIVTRNGMIVWKHRPSK